MIEVVNFFKDVVGKVSDNLTAELQQKDSYIEGVHYLHGTPKEIVETLMQRDKHESYRFRKYPLVCLFQGFQVKDLGDYLEAIVKVVICKGTLATYKEDERYAKNIIPFLNPIYEELMEQIARHKNFDYYRPLDVRKYVRTFWGREGGANVFNDKLDAIEIIFKIRLKKEVC